MPRRHELDARLHSLEDIGKIMRSMKNLSYMETRKLARFLDSQQRVVAEHRGGRPGLPGPLPGPAPRRSPRDGNPVPPHRRRARLLRQLQRIRPGRPGPGDRTGRVKPGAADCRGQQARRTPLGGPPPGRQHSRGLGRGGGPGGARPAHTDSEPAHDGARRRHPVRRPLGPGDGPGPVRPAAAAVPLRRRTVPHRSIRSRLG